MRAYLKLLRPHHWTKNGFCLAGLAFGGHLRDPEAWTLALACLGVFCAGASAIYIINDILDLEHDRQHPRKKNRPLASGAVGIPAALVIALILAGGAGYGAWLLGPRVLACLCGYLVNNLAYSVVLKHRPIVDVLSIAVGFCLRILAGVYVLGELPTTWIVLCTFFLATFLGTAKRRAEMGRAATDENAVQRPVLANYSVQFLEYMLNSCAIMALVCYALFTTSSGRNPSLVVTVPFVFYAIMHYKRIVVVLDEGEEPETILLKDWRLQLAILLWGGAFFAVEFFKPEWFKVP